MSLTHVWMLTRYEHDGDEDFHVESQKLFDTDDSLCCFIMFTYGLTLKTDFPLDELLAALNAVEPGRVEFRAVCMPIFTADNNGWRSLDLARADAALNKGDNP